ncbi:MAG TPA: alpha/beta hydrolase [Jatrophihabitans sp.]|nr:alpha/beta hydrolase [Jatrophihabitans sp.]
MTEQQQTDLDEWLIRVRPGDAPMTVEQARQRSRELNALALAQLDPKLTPASQADSGIDSPHGPLPIRVLRPAEDAAPRPTVVYFHGGGWVAGDLDTHLGHARRISVQAGAVVVMVGYRLAPEHRFPAAFEDAVFGTEWVAANLAGLGGSDTLIVAGDSAGGQLAASVALARRDAGQPLAAQLLLYPVTDVAGRYTDSDVNTGYMSRGQAHQRFGLTLEGMTAFAHHYVGAADSADWRVSPMRAADFTGVAPAVIHTSTLDVLRTEGNFYADRLREAGVEVIAREFPSLNHSYFGLGGVSAVADAAAAQAAEDLHEILRRAR